MPAPRLIVIALLVSASLDAEARPLPPGLEPEVRQLVTPRDEAPLPAGWTVQRMSIGAAAIEIVLKKGTHEVPVALREKGARASGRRLGETASFEAWLPDGASDDDRIAAEALLARLRANDAGTFWARVAAMNGPACTDPTSEGGPSPAAADTVQEARTLGFTDNLRRALTWLMLLGGLGVVLARSIGARSAALPLAMFVLALALRLGLPPLAPLHTNEHGIAELRGLVADASATRPVETDRYGVAFRQVMQVLTAPFGRAPDAVLRTNAVLGALTTLPLAAAATLLFGTPHAGLVASFAFALTPALVVLAPTESPMPLAMLLLALGLACGLLALDPSRPERVRIASGLAAGAALANASELAVTTLALPLAALFVLAGSPHRRSLFAPRITALPVLMVLLSVGSHVHALSDVLAFAADTRQQDLSLAEKLLSPDLLLRDAQLVPPALGPGLLVALGILMFQRHFAFAAGLLSSFALLFATGLIVFAARSDAIRYQSLSLMVPLLALGAIVTLRRAAPLAVATLGVTAATATAGLQLASTRTLDAAAYELARDAELPARLVVRVAPHRDGEVLSDFPEYALASRSREVRVVELPGAPEAADAECRAWLGPSCYRFTEAEVRADALATAPRVGTCAIRPGCAPLAAGVPADAPAVDVPWIDREFFVVSCARPVIGLFPCR